MRSFALRALAFSALTVLLPSAALAYEVPTNDGFYTETIEILDSAEEQRIEQLLSDYQRETSNEIAVLMVESMSGSDIREAGLETARKWRVGAEGKDNGILIIAALADREMAMEVGYGLEGAVPDITAAGIIEQVIGPRFAEGEYAEGLEEGIDALKKHIGGEYSADRYTESESGGFIQFLLFFAFIGLNFFASVLGQSRSWWLGGVIGGVIGIILLMLYGWWLAIPFFVVIGLVFDFIVSKNPPGRGGRGGGFWGGGFGGGGGGGGFGGFGGGSFGGGGARGRW